LHMRKTLGMRFWLASLLLLTLAACNLDLASNITPEPTPDLPRLEVLAPPNNSRVVEGTEFVFDIVARDETHGIARVELRIDDETIAEAKPPETDSVPVFRVNMNWLAQGIGKHFVEVIPYRPDGTQGDPAPLTLEVIESE
jgi:hypothetical protein